MIRLILSPRNKCTLKLGLIIIIMVFALGLTACNSDMDDWYITPTNFKGKVTVLFNQPSGVSVKLSGRKHIFEIPPSGILITQAAPNPGFFNADRFYARLHDGSLEEMPDFTAPPTDPLLFDNPELKFRTLVIKEVNRSYTSNDDLLRHPLA